MRYLLIMILLLVFSSVVPVFVEDAKGVEIFARHGILEDVPENTFAALKRALELGIDGLEIDVRQTKDDKLILMCDETIDRTTDGRGFIDQLLYAEIKQYDAGSWRGDEFKGERVPLLSDVLKFCKVNNLKLILNVKQACLEKRILDIVKECGMSSQVYLCGMCSNFNPEDAELHGKELVFVSQEEMTPEKLNSIHVEKKYAFSLVLDSDNRKVMKERIKMGVDVILVDYPCVVLDILNVKSKITINKGLSKNKEINSSQMETNSNAAYIQKEVKALLETMESTDDNDKAKTAALGLMVFPKNYTLPPLLKFLGNKHPHIRQNAAWTLGFCGDESIGEHIESLLIDKNAEVRREAVLALKRLNDTQAVPKLIETFKNETDRGVKYDIARALGILGGQGVVFPLINILSKEKNWYVKSACVDALGHIGSDKAMGTLVNILTTDAGEDAAWTRTRAAWALSTMGKKSVPLLISVLRDNEEATRRRASWALAKIGAPAVRPLISALHEINKFARERAAQTLGWIGDERAVTSLIWALKDKEPSVVSSSAWALGRIGNPDALSALRDLTNNKNADIRENAIEAIERIEANKETTAYYKKAAQKP